MAEAKATTPEQAKVLVVSSSPHLMEPATSRRVMIEVLLGLLPATVMSIYLFRGPAVGVILASVLGSVATEYIFNAVRKRPQTTGDCSALVAGMILGLSLPPSLPWWMAIVGGVVGIGVAKMLFGGLGSNICNPAMAGRAFLMACFGTMMNTWTMPVPQQEAPESPVQQVAMNHTAATANGVEWDENRGESAAVATVTQPTPLALAKQVIKDAHNPDKADEDKLSVAVINGQWKSMFMGNVSGSAGETSALLWLIGGAWLLWRRTITYHIPLAVLGSAMAIATLAWLIDGDVYAMPLVHLSGGGLMMAAFFIATDPVSCPLSKRGRVIFGIGVGALLMLIRLVGGYPAGVMYAVLLMNLMTPLLDRWTRPTPVGGHVRAD